MFAGDYLKSLMMIPFIFLEMCLRTIIKHLYLNSSHVNSLESYGHL